MAVSLRARSSKSSVQAIHPSRPVVVWAALGAISLIVIVITVTQWIMSPEFKPAPTGNDILPEAIRYWIISLEVFFTGGAVVMWWIYLVKPWITSGHITWDGRLLLAAATIWYQDPIDNYFNFTFTYNAHFHNMSSWANFIPGWVSPRGENFGEPYFFMGSFFMWVFFGSSVLGCWILDRFKQRFPSISMLSRMGIMFVVFAILDFLFESLLTHTQVYAYVAVYSPLSFWVGTPEQFPLYESTGIGAACAAFVALRYFRDDHGYSFFERGMQHLKIREGSKRLVSLLCLVTATQVFALVLFFGQYQWFALKADTVAKYPSYQILEICGKGTPYACPTAEVPMAKRGSIAVSPDDPRLSAKSRMN